ncbi:unnamed protein product [Kuraishia capsulata CBS 1993]|uniref:Uncharacterized protein n=1 Tax=Kuraishia capsulata CBS 1993 TaxID=1382522 RepID=W6MG70_9ASCO|nr:uncharacterized protein KUCA_T00000426001 [Kuraishia capsulata CBS 1993]CDK24463.1 unnamed protein product [Kuraishia capsulata CBS 1993]
MNHKKEFANYMEDENTIITPNKRFETPGSLNFTPKKQKNNYLDEFGDKEGRMPCKFRFKKQC